MNGSEQLPAFSSVSLEEMEHASLQSRMDEKYILPEHLLPVLLEALSGQYRVLDIAGTRLFTYHTRYFDTPGFRLYLDHHNGSSNRLKVRYRCYEDSGACFFEIKQKQREVLTVKTRVPVLMKDELDAAEQAQVAALRGEQSLLEYKLSNRFHRMTFCNTSFTERLTIDVDVTMSGNERHVAWPGVVIVERKMKTATAVSFPFLKPYLAASGFSKYALAASRLYPGLKANNFKPALLNLSKYAPCS